MKTASTARAIPSGPKLVICATLAIVITAVTAQSIAQAALPSYFASLAPVTHTGLTGMVMSLVQAL